MASSNLFPPLKPTPVQRASYETMAQRLLDATVQHYQVHTFHHRRAMSRKRWKPVKSREFITVYKERDPQPHAHADVSGCSERDGWSDPKLLVATGAVIGSLDDVMYGVVTPDAASMLLKASITQNRLVGGAVLSELEGPSAQEPFRFLGVKWFVVGAPASLHSVIRSRDLVFVEATGVRTLPNGERLGFQLMQSVTIPGYGALTNHAITRGRISSCSIFKQLANGTVDVYVRGHVEAMGSVLDAVALKFAASGFLSSWNAVGCARYKKLMWCVAHRQRRPSYESGSGNGASETPSPLAPTHHRHRACAACNRRFHKFSSVGMCVLCKHWMCSRCRVVSTLRDVSSADLSLEEKDAVVCTGCVAHVDATSAFEIAAQEVASGRFARTAQAKPLIKLWSFRGRRNSTGRDGATLVSVRDCEQDDQNDDVEDRDDDDRSDGRVAAYRARFHADGVQLYDPTQLYRSAKSRTHSSDSESASPVRSVQTPADLFKHHSSSMDTDEDEDDENGGNDAQMPPVAFAHAADSVGSSNDTYYDHTAYVPYTTRASPPQSSPLRAPPTGSPEQQLYKQMLDLQVATEQIYQMTLQTTDAHMMQRLGGRSATLAP